MSNAVGDRDGLMGAIITATAPPSFGNSDGKSKADKGVGQKKASRTQPKEVYCEGCGDTGEVMLTCSECSTVSYHPVCDDPPLEETDVKEARWQCRSCRNKHLLTEGILSKTSEKLEQNESVDDESDDHVWNPLGISDDENEEKKDKDNIMEVDEVTETDSGANQIEEDPVISGNNMTQVNKHNTTQEARRKSVKLRMLMKTAIGSAKCSNPVLFELPRSFQTNPYNFPGTSRSAIKRPAGVKVKPAIVELENYCTPRPLSCCFKCGSSCRTAPLIHCDYCPKYFHFDCLTPPLTTPPVGLWMCPLHPEHFMEAKMLRSTRLSERVALWNFTNKQVDRAAVELKFLVKCSRENPPFARKIPWPPTQRCTLDPGDGNISVPNVKESDSQIPFMDKAKLEIRMDTPLKQELYQCYSDAIQDFSELVQDGTVVELQDDIFSRISSAKVKLEFDLTGNESEPMKERNCQKPSSKVSHETKNAENFCGFDALLQAASIMTQNKNHTHPLSSRDVYFDNGTGPQISAAPEMAIRYSLKDNSPVLMEILFVDQKRKLSIFDAQVFFGTGKYEHSNTAVVDPSKFVDCPRLSSYHAILYFDAHRKQWEILNYSKHGISVDCCRYILKPKQKKIHKTSNLQTMKDEIIRKRKVLIERQYNFRPPVLRSEVICECYEHEIERCMNTIDNEGSAPVWQYSQIQIGCLRMIVTNISEKPISGVEENLPDVSVTENRGTATVMNNLPIKPR